VVCVVWAINGGRLGKRARESSSQCLPRSLRASTTAHAEQSSSTLRGLRQVRTGRHASRWTFSRSSRLLCSYGPSSIMAWHSLPTHYTLCCWKRGMHVGSWRTAHTLPAAAVSATGSLRSTGTPTSRAGPWTSWL
jgi:hypothetical protein